MMDSTDSRYPFGSVFGLRASDLIRAWVFRHSSLNGGCLVYPLLRQQGHEENIDDFDQPPSGLPAIMCRDA